MRLGTGVFDTERGFTGQIADVATGLNFYNARYQDPVLGRFISPDSIVPNPTDPAHFNRFSYAENGPLIYTDPTGHCTEGAKEIWFVASLCGAGREIREDSAETARKTVALAADMNDLVMSGLTFAGHAVKATGSAVARTAGDATGVERIYIEDTPAGNRMPVVQGKNSGLNIIDRALDDDGIALPGVTVASSTLDKKFIAEHEGTHYDEWLDTTRRTGDPTRWHVNYGTQIYRDFVKYGGVKEAYYASPYEQRAYAASGGRDPVPLTPVDYSAVWSWIPSVGRAITDGVRGAVNHYVEEFSSAFP